MPSRTPKGFLIGYQETPHRNVTRKSIHYERTQHLFCLRRMRALAFCWCKRCLSWAVGVYRFIPIAGNPNEHRTAALCDRPLGANQGCGVGGWMFDSNSELSKFPTPWQPNFIHVITTSSNHTRLVDFSAPLLESPFALMKACCQLAETLVSFLLLQQLSEDFLLFIHVTLTIL